MLLSWRFSYSKSCLCVFVRLSDRPVRGESQHSSWSRHSRHRQRGWSHGTSAAHQLSLGCDSWDCWWVLGCCPCSHFLPHTLPALFVFFRHILIQWINPEREREVSNNVCLVCLHIVYSCHFEVKVKVEKVFYQQEVKRSHLCWKDSCVNCGVAFWSIFCSLHIQRNLESTKNIRGCWHCYDYNLE